MNNTELNHKYTPEELNETNAKIIEFFNALPDAEFTTLKNLIIARHEVIESHLVKLNESQRKAFVNLELDKNQFLTEEIQKILEEAKSDLAHFVRSRSAAKKYK